MTKLKYYTEDDGDKIWIIAGTTAVIFFFVWCVANSI